LDNTVVDTKFVFSSVLSLSVFLVVLVILHFASTSVIHNTKTSSNLQSTH